MRFMAMLLMLLAVVDVAAETSRISREVFLDKMKGAWAGQMFGVCHGAPWEFRSNGAMITQDLGAWKPKAIKGAIGQDDCYVEMTFLKAIEDYGLDITFEEAGKAFGESQYPLWHANAAGRANIRRGVMPPQSGAPLYNLHADDIDFQIEADLFGILCPGMPQESNRLCNIFGHIMNYGDGVYGGMFVAGMYTAAYFESEDVEKVIRAGLACIPEASTYHKTISDVLAWHKELPNDWQTVWKRIEEKYQDDVDCMPGNSFNINANVNGAYIVMGLLYGEGDMMKTAEFSIRCGQDADCNPSNACGVLGCMKGFSRLDPAITSGIPAMAGIPFDHTSYSFDTLIETCARLSEEIILAGKGRATRESLYVRTQSAAPLDGEHEISLDGYVLPRGTLQGNGVEQWPAAEKKSALAQAIPPRLLKYWLGNSTLENCGLDMEPGLLDEYRGKKNVLRVHPKSQEQPAVLSGGLPVYRVPSTLHFFTASTEDGDYRLRVRVEGQLLVDRDISTKGEWTEIVVDVPAPPDDFLDFQIENAANGWAWEGAYFSTPWVIPPTQSGPFCRVLQPDPLPRPERRSTPYYPGDPRRPTASVTVSKPN